jgi:polar amino acid transport system permease protein
MAYQWHFEAAWEALPNLLGGVGITVGLTVTAMAGAVIIGLLLCLARLSRYPALRWLAVAYIDFVRATPLLVQILWVFYSLALLTGITLPEFAAGALALALNIGAFVAEIFRSGIQTVDKGQREASLALGMTGSQAMRRVIFPQAIRHIIPPLGSTWVSTFKDSSLVAVIGVPELLFRAQVASIDTYRPVEIYTLLAVIYFLLTYPQSRLVDRLYRRFRLHD